MHNITHGVRGWSFRTKKLSVALAVALAAIALVTGAQEGVRTLERSALSEGEMLATVDGRHMRLLCTGSGDLTYVLEAGATGFAETWTWVQGSLDDRARVCSYDRAGLGLSAVDHEGFDPAEVVVDLRAALRDAGETGPFVLVGHSLGGFFVRDFAAQYPEEVEGLVLVDSSHERQLAAFDDAMTREFRAFPGLLSGLSAASTTGVLRLWNPLERGAAGLEARSLDAARLFARDRVHLAASAEELRHWDAITQRAASQPLPATLPVLVVTAGSPVPGSADFSHLIEPLHREIAARFDHGHHVVMEEADHFSILMDRRQAEQLSRHIEHGSPTSQAVRRADSPASSPATNVRNGWGADIAASAISVLDQTYHAP